MAIATRPATDAGVSLELRRAILLTVHYADLFDHALTVNEIHRWLIGSRASQYEVEDALERDPVVRSHVERSGDLYCLRGRALAPLRRERAAASERLWRIARRYGRVIAAMPFVRLVAVSGALAVDSADEGDDIDLFILAMPGRVWLCRLLVIAVVKVAALRGHRLCPNYVLSTDRLALADRDVFTAHEIAQLVSLDQTPWYDEFRDANGWVEQILPNARGGARVSASPLLTHPGPVELSMGQGVNLSNSVAHMSNAVARLPTVRSRHAAGACQEPAERVVSWRILDGLERWEMRRKIARLRAREEREGGSLELSADVCRGHFAAHDVRVRSAFAERISRVEAAL